MGLLEGGLASSNPSCRAGTDADMLLTFGGNGFGSLELGVPSVWAVIVDGELNGNLGAASKPLCIFIFMHDHAIE